MSAARPLSFVPLLKERVWGGDALRSRAPDPPPGPVGESWEIADLGEDVSRTPDGVPLGRLLAEHAEAILGSARDPDCGGRFPLLLKLLDARDDLSVQLHPDERYLAENGLKGPAKSETWFVLHAEPGARIFRGLAPGATRPRLVAALRSGRDEEIVPLLRAVPVRAGDLVVLPAGTLHALGAGVRVVEMQRASDVTFRLYDWGRPRALQLEEGLAALRDDAGDDPAACGFTVERLDGPRHALQTDGRFHVLTVVSGHARVTTRGGELARGPLDSVLVPAAAGAYDVNAVDGATLLLFRLTLS